MASARPDHAPDSAASARLPESAASVYVASGDDTCRYPKIQDYALIGDCRSRLCWPRFDSPSIFAAMLDRDRGGHWSICPGDPQASVSRLYVPDSNVLQTVWSCRSGSVVVTDLMPVVSEAAKRTTVSPDHELVRQAECTQGEVEMEFDFFPRPFYGRDSAQLRASGNLGVRMEIGRGVYWLRSQLPLQLAPDRARTRWKLCAGEKLQFSLSYGEQAPLVLSPI